MSVLAIKAGRQTGKQDTSKSPADRHTPSYRTLRGSLSRCVCDTYRGEMRSIGMSTVSFVSLCFWNSAKLRPRILRLLYTNKCTTEYADDKDDGVKRRNEDATANLVVVDTGHVHRTQATYIGLAFLSINGMEIFLQGCFAITFSMFIYTRSKTQPHGQFFNTEIMLLLCDI